MAGATGAGGQRSISSPDQISLEGGLKKKIRTRITVETHRVVLVGQGRRATAWCEHCDLEVNMVRVDEAAAMASVSSRTIYLWVETGNVHFVETPGGLLLICSRSLADTTMNPR